MESIWSGSGEDAFFNGEAFDKSRVLKVSESKARTDQSRSYYIISVDVGRRGCDTVACILKVIPQNQGHYIKTLVNIVTLQDEHFEDQAIKLKQLYYTYNARRLVIDGNGLGIGLLDYMVKPQIDSNTGEVYPDFGVYGGNNPDIALEYKKFRTSSCQLDAIYIIKANAVLNTEAHSNVQTQLNARSLRFLVEEREARTRLLATPKGQKMSSEEIAEYLRPYVLTSILREEMINLRESNDGVNIILKQNSKMIKKDKFSAFEYGLYYIKQEESKKTEYRKLDLKNWNFFN